MLYFCRVKQYMKQNYFYIFLFTILSISTLLSTSSNAFAWIPQTFADTLKTKEVVGKLIDTRADKPKDNLIVFKPFSPFTPYLKANNKESVKTLSNVKIYPNPIVDQIN